VIVISNLSDMNFLLLLRSLCGLRPHSAGGRNEWSLRNPIPLGLISWLVLD
jgi:hypothetical protein